MTMWQYAQKLYRQYPFNCSELVLVVFIVTIYMSTAIAIIVSCFLGVAWLVTKQYRQLPTVLKKNSTTTWALALYLCFFIGLSYGNTSFDEAFATIRKYRELAFIPLLSCFFITDRFRSWAWHAFFIASVITLVGSYLMDIGVLDLNRHKSFSLKSRITHSIFIAYFMFYCAHNALSNKKYRNWYGIVLLLGVCNLFFVVEGRTGQLVFVLLVPLFAAQRFGKKGLWYALLGIMLLASIYVSFSDKSARIKEGFVNTIDYINHIPEKKRSSMGRRYQLWEHSMTIIAEKPLFGHGTGSFADAYKRVAVNKKKNSQNPHNEFLLIAAQLGLIGLVVYLGFLYSQYRNSKVLPEQEKWLAQGLLLTLITTSLFNSPFLDHTEGHWFAVMIALCFARKSLVGNPA